MRKQKPEQLVSDLGVAGPAVGTQILSSVSRAIRDNRLVPNMCDFNKYMELGEYLVKDSASKTLIFESVIKQTVKQEREVMLKISYTPKDLMKDNSLLYEQLVYKYLVPYWINNLYTPHLINYVANFQCKSQELEMILNPNVARKVSLQKNHYIIRYPDRYNFDRIDVLITEKPSHGKLLKLSEWTLTEHAGNAGEWVKVFFQLYWTLECFRRSLFKHNDLHVNNVFIEILPKPVKLFYEMNDTTYGFSTRNFVRIYDFDFSKLHCEFMNKDIDPKLREIMQHFQNDLKIKTCFNTKLLNMRRETNDYTPYYDNNRLLKSLEQTLDKNYTDVMDDNKPQFTTRFLEEIKKSAKSLSHAKSDLSFVHPQIKEEIQNIQEAILMMENILTVEIDKKYETEIRIRRNKIKTINLVLQILRVLHNKLPSEIFRHDLFSSFKKNNPVEGPIFKLPFDNTEVIQKKRPRTMKMGSYAQGLSRQKKLSPGEILRRDTFLKKSQKEEAKSERIAHESQRPTSSNPRSVFAPESLSSTYSTEYVVLEPDSSSVGLNGSASINTEDVVSSVTSSD